MGNGGHAIRRLVLGSLLTLLSAGGAVAEACRPDTAHLRGDWGQARFSVELADSRAERARGLMHRESLPRSAGMLFVYPAPQRVTFWMKNTLIPLDMIFLDEAGRVVKVHHNAQPGDLRPVFGGNEVFAVLEINGGIAETFGIGPGTHLRHPAFDPERAAWPC